MTDRASRAGLGGIDLVVHEGVLREKRYWQALAEAREPLPMLLFCPACGHQHIDAPEPERDWTNPPHRSHLCSRCGCIWRPADVATTGVERIRTQGKVDTWSVGDGAARAGDANDEREGR